MISMTTVTTAIVDKFLTEGLRRSYGGLRGAVRRRQAISRTIDGYSDHENSESIHVSRALRDLSQVIGSNKGVLTTSMANFLDEIERSAIPSLIVQSILSGSDVNKIFPSFDLLYRSIDAEMTIDSADLFSSLVEALKLSAKESVKDPDLLEFISAQNKAHSTKLDTVLSALERARSFENFITYSTLVESRAKIARSIETTHRFIPVETSQGIKRCQIKKLVVPARLKPIETDDTSIASMAKLTPYNIVNRQRKDEYISYQHFRANIDRAVILGDPGGGKSTLTQLICYDLANMVNLQIAHPGKNHIISELKLPMRIVIRSFDKRRRQTAGYDILDYLIDEFKSTLDGNIEITKKVLLQHLTLGSAFIIFDGLDEVLDVESRRDIVTIIEQFSHRFAACSALVTSRYVGYQDAPMAEEFNTFLLSQFNNNETKLFTERLIRQVEKLKADVAKKKSATFFSQTTNIASDLRQNPLMLGLMVYLFIYRGDVPSNRPEIYRECATLMFEKWDHNRDITPLIPRDFDLLHLFEHIASRMFDSDETEDGVSDEWLVGELRIFFEKWYLEKPKAIAASQSLVNFLTGRAWVMCEVGPRLFKFTHRTFLEYFFARHLISESVGVDDLIRKKLFARIKRREWDVIVDLALQTAVFRDIGKMNQATNTIMQLMNRASLKGEAKVSFLVFVSRALEYLIIPESAYCELAEEVTSAAISLGSEGFLSAGNIFEMLINHAGDRKELLKPRLFKIFRTSMKKQLCAERAFVMYCISGRGDSVVSSYGLLGASHFLGTTVTRVFFKELIDEMHAMNISKALSDPLEAQLYIVVYRKGWKQLFVRHGFEAIAKKGPYPTYEFIGNLLLDAIELAALRMIRYGEEVNDFNDASEMLELVSQGATGKPGLEMGEIAYVVEYAKLRISYLFRILSNMNRSRKTKRIANELANTIIPLLILIDAHPYLELRTPSGNRKKKGEAQRLLDFMAPTNMRRLLYTLAGAELLSLIEAWNSGDIKFSMTK